MSRLIFCGDPHFHHKSPVSRLDNYPETILGKMKFVLDLDYDYLFITGDMFSDINVSREYMVQVIELFAKYRDREIYSIIGNHDVPYADSQFVDNSPIGILFAAGVVKPLDSVVDEGWVVRGWDYKGERSIVETVQKHILVAHQYYGFGTEFDRITDKEIKKFDIVVLGHDHVPAPEMVVGKTKVFRPGSLSRLTSSTEDVSRDKVQVLAIDTDDWNHEYIDVPCKQDVFNLKYIEVARDIKKNSKMINLDVLNSEVDLDTIEQVLASIDYDPQVKEDFLKLYYSYKRMK